MTNSDDRTAIPEGAEPSLAARIAKSGDDLREPSPGEPNPVADDDELGQRERMREGDESAPRSDRVDAAAATLGTDPNRDEMSEAARGRAMGSVGGAMTDDVDRPAR